MKINKSDVAYKICPKYLVLGYIMLNSGHWTITSSKKYVRIFPVNDSVLTRHILSTKMTLVLCQPMAFDKKAIKQIGTQVPGPLHKRTSGHCLKNIRRQNKSDRIEDGIVDSQDCPTRLGLGIVSIMQLSGSGSSFKAFSTLI